MTSTGSASFTYASDNRLISGGPGLLYYDSLLRLTWYQNGGVTLDYAGDRLVTEMSNFGAGVVRRYVYGPGTDEPLVWYEGSGTSDRRFLHADERGSIVALSKGVIYGYSNLGQIETAGIDVGVTYKLDLANLGMTGNPGLFRAAPAA